MCDVPAVIIEGAAERGKGFGIRFFEDIYWAKLNIAFYFDSCSMRRIFEKNNTQYSLIGSEKKYNPELPG